MPGRGFVSTGGRRLPFLYHEGGTLPMHPQPDSLQTTLTGTTPLAENLHLTGATLFNSVGSHNGSLTALALGFRTVDAVLKVQ